MKKRRDIYLNELCKEALAHAIEAGFHSVYHTDEHYLCLVISELMEAVEADRNEKRCTCNLDILYNLQDDAVFQTKFQKDVKDTVEDELADAVIRLLDFAGLMGFQIIRLKPVDIYWEHGFTDWAFIAVQSVGQITKRKTTTGEEIALSEAIEWIFFAAKWYCFDLIKHIELKMRYNRMRPRMHGKLY